MTEMSTTLNVGQRVSTFELPDEAGLLFNLLDQLAEGPLVLVVYRGTR